MKSLRLLIFLVFIISLPAKNNAQYASSLKLNHTGTFITDSSKSLQYHSGKNAFLAGALSLIGPGFALGQIYNGDWAQFYFHITISSACILGSYISLKYFVSGDMGAGNGVLLGVAFVYMANWVWSIIDAAFTADKIDRQKFKTKHSGIMDKFGFGIFLDKNKKLNLKLAIGL